MPYRPRTCRQCGESYAPVGGRDLACAPCRGAPSPDQAAPAPGTRAMPRYRPRPCTVCAAQFPPTSPTAKYCAACQPRPRRYLAPPDPRYRPRTCRRCEAEFRPAGARDLDCPTCRGEAGARRAPSRLAPASLAVPPVPRVRAPREPVPPSCSLCEHAPCPGPADVCAACAAELAEADLDLRGVERLDAAAWTARLRELRLARRA